MLKDLKMYRTILADTETNYDSRFDDIVMLGAEDALCPKCNEIIDCTDMIDEQKREDNDAWDEDGVLDDDAGVSIVYQCPHCTMDICILGYDPLELEYAYEEDSPDYEQRLRDFEDMEDYNYGFRQPDYNRLN